MTWTKITGGLIIIVAVITLAWSMKQDQDTAPSAPVTQLPVQKKVPDFGSYKDITQKKKDFFEYMLPMIRNANARVLSERDIAVMLAQLVDHGETLSHKQQNQLNTLLQKYRIKDESTPTTDDMAQLLRRIDVVPASLILAQAANESAWGTSRFAKQAYNFFGIWCFDPGCGLTPAARDDGLTHEVAKFETVQRGVEYYLLTINTNHAYRDLRRIRSELRAENSQLTGAELAEGLLRYSERGAAYVEEIQAMIRINGLQQYTHDTTMMAEAQL